MADRRAHSRRPSTSTRSEASSAVGSQPVDPVAPSLRPLLRPEASPVGLAFDRLLKNVCESGRWSESADHLVGRYRSQYSGDVASMSTAPA